jgi:hypothetical protein
MTIDAQDRSLRDVLARVGARLGLAVRDWI